MFERLQGVVEQAVEAEMIAQPADKFERPLGAFSRVLLPRRAALAFAFAGLTALLDPLLRPGDFFAVFDSKPVLRDIFPLDHEVVPQA